MSRLASFVAAGVGGIAGAAIGGEVGKMVRGYALTDTLDELMGAIVGGAVFAAVAASPERTAAASQPGVSAPPRMARFP